MTLNKEEFKTLVMLYAANIDGNIQSEEVKVMLEKSGFETVEKMENLFDKMNDAETEALSGEIATKIQNEMTYPGQVKITVIRETRSVAYAK